MEEKDYEVVFGVILNAGSAKEKFLTAMKKAREGKFDEALDLMKQGDEDMLKAHKIQTDIIQGEARGEKHELSAIFVHSQDHLSMAMTVKDIATELIEGYKLFYSKEDAK